jgi:hypothetical protein
VLGNKSVASLFSDLSKVCCGTTYWCTFRHAFFYSLLCFQKLAPQFTISATSSYVQGFVTRSGLIVLGKYVMLALAGIHSASGTKHRHGAGRWGWCSRSRSRCSYCSPNSTGERAGYWFAAYHLGSRHMKCCRHLACSYTQPINRSCFLASRYAGCLRR